MKRSVMIQAMASDWIGAVPEILCGTMQHALLLEQLKLKMALTLDMQERIGMLPPRTECHVLLTSKNVWDKEE